MERRAEVAERELTKHKLLVYMMSRLGEEMNAIISGVAEYGFYAQAADFPVEGLVHITTLPGDYYFYDEPSHALIGQRTKRQFRLGDKLRVTVIRIDLAKRQMDLRIVTPPAAEPVKSEPAEKKPPIERGPRRKKRDK